ncbi:hypothetical protein V3851_19690 [Paenibacillus sp. M1]|uniref:Uncharacterized protein n=1 Tax=Paenibacillus haidiansis TaxID=1574488 RepID=A0ABU7VXT6_9BACL
MNKRTTLAASLAATVLISQVGLYSAEAASSSTAAANKAATVVHTVNNLAPVKLAANSTVRLSNVNILSQDEQNILTYTLVYKNNGSTTIDLTDYWTKVKTNSGTAYTVSIVSKDSGKKKLVPGAEVSVTYTARIGKNLNYSDLIFQLIKWDFSQANYESNLGSFKIPASYTISTPLNYSQQVDVYGTGVKFKVNSFDVLTVGDYKYANVALNIQNNSSSLLSKPNLKFVIQTVSGTTFTMTPDTSSTGYEIQSQDNRTINLNAKLPKNVSTNNLKLIAIETDETLKLDYPIVSMKLANASADNSKTLANKVKTLLVGNSKIETSIQSAYLNQSNFKSDVSVQLMVSNTGTEAVTVPAYSFQLQSGSTSYPITTDQFSGLTLDPGEEQNISLDASMPVSALGNLELVMKVPSGSASTEGEPATSSSSYPVAVFVLPEAQTMYNSSGEERYVKNNAGLFGVSLDAVQKLPWDNSNLLTSKLTIVNRGSVAAQLPQFAGAYKVDGSSVSESTQLINSSASSILGPGEKTSVYVVTTVPTNLNFNQVQVQLLEKKADEKTSNWVQFTNLGKLSDVAVTTNGSYYNMDMAGKKADLQEHATYVYKGTSSDVLYTEMIMRNLEDMQVALSKLEAYFKTSDGQYYKAEVTQPETTVSPKTNNIVTFSAKVPKNLTLSNMQLIVGEGINGSKLTATGETSTGFVNANAMELMLDSRDIKSGLTNIELFPYSLSIKGIEGRTSSGGLEVSFDYDLKRDITYNMGTFGHKFILEVMDSSGLKFQKEIELEKDFTIGTNQSFSYTVSDPIYQTDRSGAFQFSVYDSFGGEKTKIATYAVGYE